MSKETFGPQDAIVVSMPQLHGKVSIIEKGEVISVSGSEAQVMLEGEESPRMVPLDRLKKQDEVFGAPTDRPNELPILNQIRG
jgi:hypothetical protein